MEHPGHVSKHKATAAMIGSGFDNGHDTDPVVRVGLTGKLEPIQTGGRCQVSGSKGIRSQRHIAVVRTPD